jgi:hypothetical protein
MGVKGQTRIGKESVTNHALSLPLIHFENRNTSLGYTVTLRVTINVSAEVQVGLQVVSVIVVRLEPKL